MPSKPIHTTLDDEMYRYVKRLQKETGLQIKQVIQNALELQKQFDRNEFLVNKKELHNFSNLEMIDWIVNHFEKIEGDMNKIILAEIINTVLNKYMKEYGQFAPKELM